MKNTKGKSPQKRQFDSLKNPPAVEAVLDITTNEIEDVNVQSLDVTDGPLIKKFPIKEQIHLFESSFQETGKQQQVTYKNRPLGYMYKSEDLKEITQFRVNGFSYNRLQPYPGWDSFIESGLKSWKAYREARKSLEIKRIGLRFINIIKVPDQNLDLSKYFRVSLTSKLKTGLGNIKQFQYRYVREFEGDSVAIVNFSQNETVSGHTGFVFDIDVIKQVPSKNLEQATISEYLREMRQAKNTIFFDTLTNKALENSK